MAVLLLLPLILLGAAEITLFILIGGWIGVGPTLLAILGTGLLGAWLMRRQGLTTLSRVQAALARRELPVKELFDGACILIGGILLLLPGFLSDVIGVLLLLPPGRALLRRLVMRRLVVVQAGRRAGEPAYGPGSRRSRFERGPVLDGTFEEVSEPDGAPRTLPPRGPAQDEPPADGASADGPPIRGVPPGSGFSRPGR